MLMICNGQSWHLLLYREIVDNTGKENGIDLIMGDRTYHLIAESPEDARYENHQAFFFSFLFGLVFQGGFGGVFYSFFNLCAILACA